MNLLVLLVSSVLVNSCQVRAGRFFISTHESAKSNVPAGVGAITNAPYPVKHMGDYSLMRKNKRSKVSGGRRGKGRLHAAIRMHILNELNVMDE